MGGFGAMLHGGHLASAVVAFGPQVALKEATLRPPGVDGASLEMLQQKLCDSVRLGRTRGATIKVHCAADEHFGHALALPLEELEPLAVTVHPLLPRKPFARLLDKAALLMPIVSDAVRHVLARAAASSEPAHAAAHPGEPSIAVACWLSGGRFARYSSSRSEILGIFFGRDAPHLPRPGDWHCPKCLRRNMISSFFCPMCGSGDDASDGGAGCGNDIGDGGASCVSGHVSRILGGREYPRKGDWGCRKCGMAMGVWDLRCLHCGVSKDGPDAFVVQ